MKCSFYYFLIIFVSLLNFSCHKISTVNYGDYTVSILKSKLNKNILTGLNSKIKLRLGVNNKSHFLYGKINLKGQHCELDLFSLAGIYKLKIKKNGNKINFKSNRKNDIFKNSDNSFLPAAQLNSILLNYRNSPFNKKIVIEFENNNSINFTYNNNEYIYSKRYDSIIKVITYDFTVSYLNFIKYDDFYFPKNIFLVYNYHNNIFEIDLNLRNKFTLIH